MKLQQLYDVDLYMKSGNVVRLKRLKSFTFSPDKVQWESSGFDNRLIDVRPSQIEAVIQVRAYKRIAW